MKGFRKSSIIGLLFSILFCAFTIMDYVEDGQVSMWLVVLSIVFIVGDISSAFYYRKKDQEIVQRVDD